MKATAFLLLSIFVLPGCMTPGSNLETGQYACIDIYCITSSNSHAAQVLKQKYSIQQFIFTPWDEKRYDPRMEDGFVVWQQARSHNGTRTSDIVGYDFAINRIISIETGLERHTTNQRLYGNNVAFAQSMNETRSMGVWNRTTGNTKDFYPELKGLLLPKGFDGNWILFDIVAGGSDGGQYALNVHDERLLQLRKDLPGPSHANGTGELLAGLGLAHGVAYIAILWNYGDDRGGPNKDFESVIYAFDLEHGGAKSVFQRLSMQQINRFDVSDDYVAWDAFTDHEVGSVWAKNIATGTLHGPFTGPSSYNHAPKTKGDWLLYRSMKPDTALVAVHLPTNTTHVLIPAEAEIDPVDYAPDGKYVVISAHRRIGDTLFDKTWTDKDFITDEYFMELPPVPNTLTEKGVRYH